MKENKCSVCKTIKNVRFFDYETATFSGKYSKNSDEPTKGGINLPENCDENYYCDFCVEKLYSKWWERESEIYLEDYNASDGNYIKNTEKNQYNSETKTAHNKEYPLQSHEKMWLLVPSQLGCISENF